MPILERNRTNRKYIFLERERKSFSRNKLHEIEFKGQQDAVESESMPQYKG
jgi:hypothetical protein